MHRPFYSLAVLLQIIALSLVLVGSASSQPWQPWLESAEKRAHVNGEMVRREWSDFYRSVVKDFQASGEDMNRAKLGAIPWASAADRTIGTSQFVATGYDADYDFAMLDGHYDDVAASTVDIENSMAAVEVEHPAIEVFSISCPATSYYFDDWECCLDAGFSSPVYVPSRTGGVSRGDVSWCGEAEGWVEASACFEGEVAAESIEFDVWPAMMAAVEGTSSVINGTFRAYWSPVTEQKLDRWMMLASAEEVQKEQSRQAEQTLEHLTSAGNVVLDNSAALLKSSWIAIRSIPLPSIPDDIVGSDLEHAVYHLDVQTGIPEAEADSEVLIQAATTLDHMGLILQQAAQSLRYLAADRIVSNPGANRR